MAYPTYLTIDLVRQELQDRSPLDNSIDCDIFFSDEEILHAMDRAAARYNALAPIGIDVKNPKCLPANTSVFLDAVLSCLYSAAIHKLSRNLMTWQTGDASVDLEKTRLDAFRALKQETEQAWKEAAKERKMEINRQLAWGFF
jgi:hypothetical protein